MRLRNIPGSREAIASSPFVIPEQELASHRGRWHEVFSNSHPLFLEIGSGKGRFITELAEREQGSNFLGIEKYSSVLIKALAKRASRPDLNNLFFIRMDAEYICDVFAPGEIAGIYLNFSDPWPKDRHAKRRLPGTEFLARYRQLLVPGGTVEFKTDNITLFSYALESVRTSGWNLLECTWDLHHDERLCEGNIMTEYEAKFSAAGNKICKLTACP